MSELWALHLFQTTRIFLWATAVQTWLCSARGHGGEINKPYMQVTTALMYDTAQDCPSVKIKMQKLWRLAYCKNWTPGIKFSCFVHIIACSRSIQPPDQSYLLHIYIGIYSLPAVHDIRSLSWPHKVVQMSNEGNDGMRVTWNTVVRPTGVVELFDGTSRTTSPRHLEWPYGVVGQLYNIYWSDSDVLQGQGSIC